MCINDNKYAPIFDSFGQPIFCSKCGADIVGEQQLSLLDSVFVCDNGCWLRGNVR